MNHYFLETLENNTRTPVGRKSGYTTLEEAISASKHYTDDTADDSKVLVLQLVGYSYVGGNGADFFMEVTDEEKDST